VASNAPKDRRRVRRLCGFLDGARYAVAEAAAGGRVLLMHALLDRAEYAAMVRAGPVAEAPTEARRLLDNARDALLDGNPGVEVQAVVVDRAPSAALIRASRSADLLVLGRHRNGRAPMGAEFRRTDDNRRQGQSRRRERFGRSASSGDKQ
jgi:hypothetical protein